MYQYDEGDGTVMSEEKAAEKIQASFKGYKVRKSLKNNGVLPAKEDGANNKSNVVVEEKAQKSTVHPSKEIASKPNPAQEEETVDIDLTDPEVGKAAAKIQSSYRNFTKKKQELASAIVTNVAKEPEKETPKECKNPEGNGNPENKQDDEENLEDIDLDDPDVAKAALKIQSTFRGYKIRKEINITEVKPLENGEKGDDE